MLLPLVQHAVHSCTTGWVAKGGNCVMESLALLGLCTVA